MKNIPCMYHIQTLQHCCACPKPRHEFPTTYFMVFLYSMIWGEKFLFVFCWNWWNCCPLLFKLPFHKIFKKWTSSWPVLLSYKTLFIHTYIYIDLVLDLLCLAPPSAIFQRLVLVVEEAGVPDENHRPWASNWYTLSLAADSWVHHFLQFTKPCANIRRIGDTLIWVDR